MLQNIMRLFCSYRENPHKPEACGDSDLSLGIYPYTLSIMCR